MNRNLLYLIFLCIGIISCKSPEARKPVQTNSGTFIINSAERNKELYDLEKEKIAAIIDSDSTHTYFTSENGFWYYYQIKDTISTTTPAIGDHIKFSYNVSSLKGEPILSTTEIGEQNYIVDKSNQELISGLRDGVKLMKEGETITFYFPSYKAYGYYGITDKLGTNVPVKCTVTLNNIIKSNENY